MAVNFAGRTAAANFPASDVWVTTVAGCAAVAMNLLGYVVVAKNFAAIAAATKRSVVDRVEAANFAAGVDEVTDAADRVVGAASCVGGAAVETSAGRVARTVNSVADAAVTSVAECVARTANVARVLARDVAAIAIALENADAAVDTGDTVNTGSCNAIRVAYRG